MSQLGGGAVRGYTENKDSYLLRLRRIEGQVRGLQRMVEDDKYCIDILTQVAAVTRALQSVALGLLDEHLTHCVTEAVAEGGDTAEAKVREASDAIARLGWFFFAPRRARTAELAGGVQRITVTVRGGYSPDVIRARPGVPLEVVFDRQESGDCTSRVVFPDLAVSASLPAFERTTVQ